MLIIASTGDNCIRCELKIDSSTESLNGRINKSVGINGFNQKKDVLTIQKLLNSIEPINGGAQPLLVEDGIVGSNTNGAIKTFQQRWALGRDNRVDPNGPMLNKMNALPKTQRFNEAAASRLKRATNAIPDLIAMARKAELTCDQAMMAVRNGKTSTSNAYRLANLYFKFDNEPIGFVLNKLLFIRTTFIRVKGILISPPSPLSGGNPFGSNVFANDPLGRSYMAYVPTNIANDPSKREHPNVHPGNVYLCTRIDLTPSDLFTHILMHEIIHFVDEETSERYIADHGYRDKAMRLPHNLRMHNSDNYALFSSHLHFGRIRLISSQPTLAPFIPTDL